MVTIPIADFFVIERDRNRNEMYGEAFWIYGFDIYNKTDSELINELPKEWGYNDGEHTLPGYINVTYEYPVFGLIFFAVATWLFPGAGGLQPLWLNFILILVFNLNLVLIALLLGDKIYRFRWARLFFAAYYVYGFLMSAVGGKLEPVVECLLFMALVLRKVGQTNNAMFTLGLSVQTKVYSAVAFPLLFVERPLSSIWFFASTLLTVVPSAFLGANLDSFLSHFLNRSSYSTYIANPMYPGLAFATPGTGSMAGTTFVWLPALIPVLIYVVFMLYTIPLYLPQREKFAASTWREKINSLKPLYIYLLPTIFFVFRWIMPWYLLWLGGMVVLYDDDEQAVGYLKQMAIVGLLYAFGVVCNWSYLKNGPLPYFLAHFPFGWWTFSGLLLLVAMAIVSYLKWKNSLDNMMM